MTNPITTNPVEDTVTDMQSEHIDTLKREIELKEFSINNLKTDSNILSYILAQVIEQQDMDANDLKDIISDMTHDRSKVIDTMIYWDVVRDDWFNREYEVTISVPVSLTLSIEAINEDDAEERALSQLDCERLEAFDLDYSVYYDAEIIEVREV